MIWKTALLLLAFTLVALTTLTAIAQNVPGEFVHAGGRFALAAVGEPLERDDKDLSLANCELVGKGFVWRDSAGNYTEVQYYAVTGAKLRATPAEKKAVVEALRKGFTEAFTKAKATSQSSVFADGDFAGIEIRAVGARKLITRIFFVKDRLFVLTLTRENTSFEEIAAETKKFRILSKEEYIAALLAEHTPKALPQDAPAKLIASDLKNERLVGKVKTVFTDSQEGVKGGRQRASETYYDERGNKVKEISFMAGYPIDVHVWGWIDGKRVEDFDSIDYDLGDGPNEKRLEIIVAMGSPDSAMTPPVQGDDRYTYSYDYLYNDSGELTETRIVQNNGELWQKLIDVYKPGQHEQITYGEDSKISSRSVEILDKNGNVVEERNYDDKGALLETWVYRYELDNVGNWKTRSEFKKVRGKVAAAPSSFSYRQFTYY